MTQTPIAKFTAALPFWMSIALFPLAVFSATTGGWAVIVLPLCTWYTIGINYAHELMHQKPKVERNMADALLAMVLYSHFRSEHMLVHHRYVATRRDPVSAHYNEGFWRFFPRVLRASYWSAFQAEKAMLARKGLPWHDKSNPFWTYWLMQATCLLLARSPLQTRPPVPVAANL